MFIKKIKFDRRGALLLEVLVVIGILAVIVSFASQLFLTSARSSKLSRERNVAEGLAGEILEAVKAASIENWPNIYRPPDGSSDPVTSKGSSNHYYVYNDDSKWLYSSGEQIVPMNNVDYTRYFTVENVSRDLVSRNIENVYNPVKDDPSTQKITVVVSWAGAQPISLVQYMTRWRNKVCVQTNWSEGATKVSSTCPYEGYGAIDSNIDVGTVGSIKLKAQ